VDEGCLKSLFGAAMLGLIATLALLALIG